MGRQQAKAGQLIAYYGKLDRYSDPDLCVSWGGEGARKSDGGTLCHVFDGIQLWDWGTTFLQELEKRGYDLSTMKFSIEQKRG